MEFFEAPVVAVKGDEGGEAAAGFADVPAEAFAVPMLDEVMLHDAHLDRFDCAVVVSGDSDLLMPVEIVRYELKKVVGVLNPQKRECVVLKAHATAFAKSVLQNVAPPPLTMWMMPFGFVWVMPPNAVPSADRLESLSHIGRRDAGAPGAARIFQSVLARFAARARRGVPQPKKNLPLCQNASDLSESVAWAQTWRAD